MPRWEEISLNSNYPCARINHTAVVWKHFLHIFGGFSSNFENDHWKYNFKTKEWKKFEKTDETPPPTAGHTAVVYKNAMYIFGGYLNEIDYKDVFEFDFHLKKWNKLNVKGNIPLARQNHTAVIYQDSMYVFAGFNEELMKCNDLQEFNIPTKTWKQIYGKGEVPTKRSRHSACVFKDEMIVFGGFDMDYINDVHVYNFTTNHWKKISIKGNVPKLRFHRSIIINDISGPSMYIFGGMQKDDSEEFSSNHLYKLELNEDKVWKKVEVENAPKARYLHQLVEYNDAIYVFSGIGDNNLKFEDFYKLIIYERTLFEKRNLKVAFYDIKF